jgi:hypothetical protein
MGTAAIADISITGGAKVNYTNTNFDAAASVDTNTINHDVDFTIVGKSGDTTVSATFATTGATVAGVANTAGAGTNNETTTPVVSIPTSGGLITENVFVSTKIGDFNIKTGSYAGGDSNLGNGTRSDGKISIDTTIAGVKVQFEDSDAASNGASVTVSGTVSGVALSHEVFDTKTESKISGSVQGISIAYVSMDSDAADTDETSLVISGEMGGVTATYVSVDVDGAGQTSSDDFFGTHTAADINEAAGFSLKTSIAGNTVTLKSYDIKQTQGAQDDSYTKIVVTRPIAGATFEATYTDADMVVNTLDSVSLDLELAVKF